MFPIFLILVIVFNNIPDEYNELVINAQKNLNIRLLSNEKKIFRAGKYSINHFDFKLNAQVISYGTQGFVSCALNKTKKIVAIISRNTSNTKKNTILSIPSQFQFIMLGDKIAEDGDVSIIKYSNVDPFSIFSDFHFSNFENQISGETSFSTMYKPLKSFKGNDIYQRYSNDKNCSTFNSAAICRRFINNNFPIIRQGTNISQLIPNQIKTYFIDDENNNKFFETRIGGVFGLFSGIDIRFKNPSDLKVQLFQASEAETQIQIILPPGKYTNKNIVFEEKNEKIFDYKLNIFDCEYNIIVNGISKVKVTNITYNSTQELMFNQRAGYKSQKEFQIRNWKSSKISSSSESISYDLIRTDISPPSKNFSTEKLELNISIYTGLEVILQARFNEHESNFTINSGVEFKREITANYNSAICPCPYLHGKNTDVGLFNLKTLNPFIYNNMIIVPAKTFYENELFWLKKNPNSWCLGGNLYSYDENTEQGIPNSAILNIKSVKYGTEYKDKSNSVYNMVICIYDINYNLLKTIESRDFQFSEQSILNGLETKLNYIHFIDNLLNSTIIQISCIDSKGVIFNGITNYNINQGFNDLITLKSLKGTPIFVSLSISTCIFCNFEIQTDIQSSSIYAAVKTNVSFDNSIGLITHEYGSVYNGFVTSIYDEYSNEDIFDCAYNIKNIKNIEISSFDVSKSIDFESLSILIEKEEEENPETIISITCKKDDIESINTIKKNFAINKIDSQLQITVIFKQDTTVISYDKIKFVQNFIDLQNGIIDIQSNDNTSWKCRISLESYNYPIVFDINSVKSGTSLIFAPVYTSNNPFSQKIINECPSTVRINCPKISPINRYGIYKLEFELELESFNKIINDELTALVQMKDIKPICSYKKIDDDLYSIKLPKSDINQYSVENKTIFYYPIPFRFINDSLIIPSIQIIDIFQSPENSNEICDFDEQMFPSTYSSIHYACIAKDNDVNIINFLKIYCEEKDVSVTKYTFPSNNEVVKNWRLIGFSLLSNKDLDHIEHHIIIEQNETVFPTNEYILYIDNMKNDMIYKCPRCKAIRAYWKEGSNYGNEYFYENQNQKFLVPALSNKEYYYLYPVCKTDAEKYCEKTLNNLNDFSLISVPLVGKILDENIYLDVNDDNAIKRSYSQFAYDRQNITYLTDLKSKIEKIISFNGKLRINIVVKKVGSFVIISAIETIYNCLIPFTTNINYVLETLSIKYSTDQIKYYISGSIFLCDNAQINELNSIDIIKAPQLFDLPNNFYNKFEIITVSYLDKQNIENNKYCFYQNNENSCKTSRGLSMRYPEFNEFMKLENITNNSIYIDVLENLNFFYPNFKYDGIQNLVVTLSCSSPKFIKGEIKIPPGLTINFNGEFDLKELYITTKVNWKNQLAGITSFKNVKTYPQIDVEIEEHSQEHDKYIELVLNGNPNLNLLQKSDSQNIYEYIIHNNKIYCLLRQTDFQLKNDFCIYKTNKISCKYVNNSMNSIPEKDLNNFDNYFEGTYEDKIRLHLADNITFTNETFQTFFNNHPDIIFQIQSEMQSIYLDGIIKLPKNITLLFKENDHLDIHDLIIEKSVSILYNSNSIDDGYIDLNDKEINSIIIYGEDLPKNSKSDDSIDFVIIRNCDESLNISIHNKTFITDYLKISLKQFYYNNNYYINVLFDVIYKYPNIFCVYEDIPYDFVLGHPIKSSEIKKITKFIDTQNYDNLTLNILDDVNFEIDFSNFNDLKYVFINGQNSFKKLSGKIKISEKTKASLNNLDIGNLTIDIDVNILDKISSYYDIFNCKGIPNIKTYPHLFPTNMVNYSNNLCNVMALKCKKDISFTFDILKLPMHGGYIIQKIITNITKDIQLLYIIYEYQEIRIESSQNNHYYLFQNNNSTFQNNNMNISEFCLANFMKNSNSNEYIFQISENITLSSTCYLDASFNTKNKKEILIFGDYFIKGNMTIFGEVDIIIFNSKIIKELQITLNIEMPQNSKTNKIIVPSIITYEGSKPKSLNINISNYLKEIESSNFESRQFLKGICMDTINKIPTPYNRDFRIRPVCSNVDGIFGMKIKTLIQKYNPNQICFYDTSFSKCIYNTKLESYLPVRYSEIPPSFVKGGDDFSIYLYDSPEEELTISFQIASLLNHKKATIVNNDNAKVKIFIPSDFILDANESFSMSEFYFQFKFNRFHNYKYGTIQCLDSNIIIHPIPINHGTFIYEDKIVLSNNEFDFSSNLGQDQYVLSRITYKNATIRINDTLNNYQEFNDDIIYDSINIYKSKIVCLSTSKVFNPYKIYHKKLGIQSKDLSNTLTFDLTNEKKLSGNQIFISEATIDFKKKGNIDFKDLNITFYKCELDKKWLNQISGENLYFDAKSYYSFYTKTGRISAFNGDHIQTSLQNNISLQNDEFKLEDSTLIKLSSFNSFVDNYGKTVKFTGYKTMLSIGSVTNNTNLYFYDFSKLTIITESILGNVYLIHVKNCVFQLSSEENQNYIDTIDTGKNDQTEIKSNGIIIVKKLIVSSNFQASSNLKIFETEIKENNNITIQNGNFIYSITIRSNSYLILDSYASLSEVKINIYGQFNNYFRLILGQSNYSINFKSIDINLFDQQTVTKGYLIKGLQNCNKNLKNKVHIFNSNLKDISKKYKIKCEKDSDSMFSLCIYFKSKMSGEAIAGIVIGVIAFIAIIATIIYLLNKKNNTNIDLPSAGVTDCEFYESLLSQT